MRTPLIAGNWKMYNTLAEARELVKGIRDSIDPNSGVEVLICPPFTLLFPMAKAVDGSPVMLGAQDAHQAEQGAFTGEVSVAMLKDAGCTHVIIGHSERRQIYGEDGPLLAKKVRAALNAGLTAIFCVGETLKERESGQTHMVVERQMAECVGPDLPAERLIIAYEPVWAIGTGETASPEQAQEIHAVIRSILGSTYARSDADTIRILYGGSVKPANAAELANQSDIDGALVGGASLVSADFAAIIAAAAAEAATTR